MANRSAARRCDPAGRRLRGILCGGAVMESEEKENRQGGPCGLLCLLCCLPLFSLPSGGVVQCGRRWRRSAPRFHVSRFTECRRGYFSRGDGAVLFAAAEGVRFYT